MTPKLTCTQQKTFIYLEDELVHIHPEGRLAPLASSFLLDQASPLQFDFKLFGNERSIIMSSGKAVQRAKAIDWDYLQRVVVSDSGKRELAGLRRAYDDVAATINEKFNIVRPSPDLTF